MDEDGVGTVGFLGHPNLLDEKRRPRAWKGKFALWTDWAIQTRLGCMATSQTGNSASLAREKNSLRSQF